MSCHTSMAMAGHCAVPQSALYEHGLLVCVVLGPQIGGLRCTGSQSPCRAPCYVPRSCGSASSRPPGSDVATVEDVRWLGSSLERSYQVYVRGRLKFRVKQIVYVAFSLDETEMGFAFPKEERASLVGAQPHRFHLPRPSDLRFNWVEADLAVHHLAGRNYGVRIFCMRSCWRIRPPHYSRLTACVAAVARACG